jgi:hypothetical protein
VTARERHQLTTIEDGRFAIETQLAVEIPAPG